MSTITFKYTVLFLVALFSASHVHAVAPITWTSPCPFTAEEAALFGGMDNPVAKALSARRDCAHLSVPLDWSKPGGRNITVYVRRFLGEKVASPSNTPGSYQQFWTLSGGPGGDNNGGQTQAELFKGNPWDVYVMDHRGTGQSTYLTCKQWSAVENGEVGINDILPDCLMDMRDTYGAEGLAGFSTTNAAMDVRFVMESERQARADKQDGIIVYGESYGTLWAQRVLQLEEAGKPIVDKTILDGIVSPEEYDLRQQTTSFTATLRLLATSCAANATCSKYLGREPYERIKETMAKLDAGHCKASGIDSYTLKRVFPVLTSLANAFVAPFALIHRLNRCYEGDLKVLQKAAAGMENVLKVL